MIVDGHTHVSDTDFGNAKELLRQLDEAGIERAVCVPGGMIDMRQFSRILSGKCQPDPHVPNHLVYTAIDQHADRLYGFVCIDPKDAAALDTLREGFDRGCRGLKLAPLVHRFAFQEPVLDDAAAACGERGFPVYSHVVPSPGATTADFADFAARHPDTTFILGHMGFGPCDADAMDFAEKFDNFYLETSLGNCLALRDALAQLGSRKLIFGSEFPLSHPKVELEKIRLLDAGAQDAITRENILRVIGVS